MIKTARQLKDLIRNLSREKSADAQLLMRNYMMERFLERISLSEYRDKFILKGGMLVAAMVGLDARSTMDLDATVKGANVNVEEIENLISAIVSVPLDDGVKFQLKSISEIMQETGLSRSSVHSYLLYTKIIYNADELSLYAERCRLYRERKQAVEKLHCCIGKSYELLENHLWETLKLFSGYSFTTVKGLRFHYTVNGNEILIDRKKKSITRSSVNIALKETIEMKGNVNGPKKLKVFGASYLYPIFLRFDLIKTERE